MVFVLGRARGVRWAALVLLAGVGCGARTTLSVEVDAARADASVPRIDAGFDGGVEGVDGGLDGGFDGGFDAGLDGGTIYVPPEAGCAEVRMGVRPPSDVPQVDLLFVIDDSRSMAQEQELLAESAPLFVRTLASGDLDGDGSLDFPPVTDLQVGVISTDLGWVRLRGDELVATSCLSPDGVPGGRDGLLQPIDPTRVGCEGMPTQFFLRYSDGDSIDAFERSFGCMASLGVDGCGFEQPLEAALKALTPSTSPVRFLGDAVGHGDSLNAGFLRPGSILAIVVVSDEDDVSVADASFLELGEERFVLEDGWRHPIARYVDGFAALRADPAHVVFAAIAGVPPELSGPIDTPERADAILADSRMQRRYDPDSGTGLRPACTSSGGSATPPRRLVEVARGMAGRAVVQSICEDDFRPAVAVIAQRLGELVETTWCVDGEGP
ncbi:MAG: hypothetical protein H6719_25430 [Sandaracinaceae bacterium]|nr:hypothetical protein [Sandaracinaceae bacterium]